MRSRCILAQPAIILLSTLSLLSLKSSGQPVEGWYSAAGIGENIVNPEKISKTGTPFGDQPGGDARLRHGYAVVGSVGWGFAHGFRIEGEGGYRRNALYQATAGALKAADAQGSENKSSLFLNAFYQYDREYFGITPYIGAGLGYTWIKWKNVMVTNATETVRFNDTQGKRAYQGILGFSFLRHVVPGMSVTAEYRIQGLDGSRVHEGRVLRSRFGAFPTSATVTNSLNQTFMIGIRFQSIGRPR